MPQSSCLSSRTVPFFRTYPAYYRIKERTACSKKPNPYMSSWSLTEDLRPTEPLATPCNAIAPKHTFSASFVPVKSSYPSMHTRPASTVTIGARAPAILRFECPLTCASQIILALPSAPTEPHSPPSFSRNSEICFSAYQRMHRSASSRPSTRSSSLPCPMHFPGAR